MVGGAGGRPSLPAGESIKTGELQTSRSTLLTALVPVLSARWEKQELERQVRELKKQNDELHKQGKRRGSLTRSTSFEKDEPSDGGKTDRGDAKQNGAKMDGGKELEKVKAEKEELVLKVKDVSTSGSRICTSRSNM